MLRWSSEVLIIAPKASHRAHQQDGDDGGDFNARVNHSYGSGKIIPREQNNRFSSCTYKPMCGF